MDFTASCQWRAPSLICCLFTCLLPVTRAFPHGLNWQVWLAASSPASCQWARLPSWSQLTGVTCCLFTCLLPVTRAFPHGLNWQVWLAASSPASCKLCAPSLMVSIDRCDLLPLHLPPASDARLPSWSQLTGVTCFLSTSASCQWRAPSLMVSIDRCVTRLLEEPFNIVLPDDSLPGEGAQLAPSSPCNRSSEDAPQAQLVTHFPPPPSLHQITATEIHCHEKDKLGRRLRSAKEEGMRFIALSHKCDLLPLHLPPASDARLPSEVQVKCQVVNLQAPEINESASILCWLLSLLHSPTPTMGTIFWLFAPVVQGACLPTPSEVPWFTKSTARQDSWSSSVFADLKLYR